MVDSEWVTITEEDEWETITEPTPRPKPTAIEKVGQYYKEIAAAPVRTIESMVAGGVGGLIRMGAEAITMQSALTRANKMIPGAGTLVEHVMRKYGPTKAYSFYDRKVKKLADAGKKIQDFWIEQANKGWEAPNPDIVEARWRDRPASKTVSAVSSGLTSIGVVVGTTFLTKSPHAGLAMLAASETGGMYGRLRDEDVSPDVASKLAMLAGAWTYATEKIGFDKLLKPGAKTIMNALKKGGWEGLQEVVETMGHNLLEYFGYDYRKPGDIPTAVKAAFDHIMDGWQDALVGGIGAGGMVHVMLPGVRPGTPVPIKRELTLEQATILSGQMPEGSATIELKNGRHVIESMEDFTTHGDMLVKFNIDSEEIKSSGFITDIGYETTERKIPLTPTSELMLQPPTVEELTKKPIEEIEPQTPDHTIGHQYGLSNEQVDSRLNEAELRYRELKLKETDGKVADIIRLFSEHTTEQGGLERGLGFYRSKLKKLSDKELKEILNWTRQPERTGFIGRFIKDEVAAIMRERGLKPERTIAEAIEAEQIGKMPLFKRPIPSPIIRTTAETDELAFLSRNRTNIEAILERETQPVTPPKIKRTQKNLLVLGHKIAKEAELTDEEYRDFAETVTGKRSMGDMSKAERNEFVSALEESYGTPKELLPEDYDMPITVAGRATSMREVYNEASKATIELTPKRKIPAIIKLGFGKVRAWQWLKSFAVGIDNTPVFHLARILDNGTEGIFSEVLDKGTEHGGEIAKSHERQVTEVLINNLQESGVTDDDLAKMGRSVNPRLRTHQMISKGAATETFIESINNQDYEMTWANLMHIYLYSNQEAGMRHIKGGGLVIEGVKTGPLSEERINDMRQKVEENPKAKVVVDTILEIGEKIWKPSINIVSRRTEGKDIATEPKWFGLRVYMPRKLPGKTRIGKFGQFGVNFIEDKGMFHDRTKSTLPLIVGDVFSEFSSFENATAEYVGMAEPSRTSRTLLNDPSIAAELDQKGYGRVRHHILAIHKQAQSLPISEGNFSAWFAKRLPGLYRAVLLYNPRLVVSQKTSTWNYGAFVSPKYRDVKAGLNWENIQRTLRLSNVAWDRFHMAHSSLELGEATQSDAVLRMWTGGKSSDINKAGWAMKMADASALTDGMASAWKEYPDAQNGTIGGESAIWWADKEDLTEMNIEMWEEIQAKEENASPEERQAAEQWKRLVTKRAEYLWQHSQPSWDKWNRSYLTSQKGLRRILLLFRSFHEKSLTICNEVKLDYEHSSKTPDDLARAARRTSAVLTGYTVNKLIRLAMAALLYRERKSLVKIGEELLTSWMDMFPIFGKALKITVNRFIDTLAGEKPSYIGEALESFPVRVANMVLKSPVDMAEATAHVLKGENKEAEEAFMRGIGRLAENVGMLYGYPAPEVKRLGTWLEKEEEPTGKRGPARRTAPARRGPR